MHEQQWNTLQFYLFYNLQRKVLSKITQSKHTLLKNMLYKNITINLIGGVFLPKMCFVGF